ncbi:MAG: hypothetical protein MPN21_24450 [Thermoanaerobaculia bacterium]|nr:hypothetical protein [Thermoanaerobaculia bacterium]
MAAAPLAKGLSPGAALNFLLAGPATNACVTRTFGARFVRVYVSSVAVGSLAYGLLLDALTAVFGCSLALPSRVPAHHHAAPGRWRWRGARVPPSLGDTRLAAPRMAELTGGAKALGRTALGRLGLA